MKPSSPQLDEPQREPVEAAVAMALAALRRIARGHGRNDRRNRIEVAGKALARIEALLPGKARGR